ncbi:CheR family methyltransferase [Gallaecimonas pentaromativorans]|uniref:Chemotaxis protein methyltransferase n=1 Tax=Gallaecimonas pentaromativorans TaxID=584787 RepID=A0A3N1PAK7_9GAMM|nr:protein-glutamate O-methyltransferase CheR [Gallaecimonas pentaromativorans]ROQ24808.1 chemotaxis protein methyltransferase CheR [Gallaecimonas pentaromativorans]
MGSLLNPADGFAFTAEDFAFVRSRIFDMAGIRLSDQKDKMVYSRLSRRIRELGLGDFSQYLRFLDSSRDEQVHFVNALTTNKTQFFRESHHFDFLAELAAGHSEPLRVWSAACSTGEEPYSIAAQLVALGREQDRILATDLNTQVLHTAETGFYDINEAANIPPGILKQTFLKGTGRHSGLMQPSRALRARVSFRQLNLIGPWPFKQSFDVIFCRNVMIYFDKPTQNRLVTRFCQQLKPGGYLLLGHAEGLDKAQRDFVSIGKTIYQKVAG